MAIVGRPNVGKSSLFNRLAGRRLAIVEDTPGVTRDRLFAPVEWDGYRFTVVDTGGLDLVGEAMAAGFSRREGLALGEGGRASQLVEAVRRQALAAIEEADVIVFVVDGQAGVQPGDEEVAEVLRRAQKPVLLAVNKMDNRRMLETAPLEFYALGLGDPIGISAQHGLNISALLDAVVAKLPQEARRRPSFAAEGPAAEGDKADDRGEEPIRVAVVGRPNVGKSSLVNRLTGKERSIVSDVPGTTRDPVDVRWRAHGRAYEFVDTAGLRRKAKVETALEYYSVLRTLRAVERADVVVMIIDAVDGVTEQDKKIAGYGHDRGKPTILLVNKWDLIEKDEHTINEYTKRVRNELLFLSYAPILFVSMRTGQRLGRLPELIARVAANSARRVETSELNRVLETAQRLHNAPGKRGRQLKIYYGTQVGIRPPTFLLFVNDPGLMHYSYERYLENQIREAFDFEGTPIQWRYQARRRPPRREAELEAPAPHRR